MSRPLLFDDEALNALHSKPITEVSVEELSLFFNKGEKPRDKWLLGLEIELFAHDNQSGNPLEFERLQAILEKVNEIKKWTEETDPNGGLVGLMGEGQLVSLEPGGQLEYASAPYRSLRELRRSLTEFVGLLSQATTQMNGRLLAMGQQAHATVETIPKMPKNRYDVMRGYLPDHGALALDMMHLTGSMQCAVDFSSETNMADKIRTAARVSPFLAALAAASPFTDGKPNGFKSRRYEIWLHTDNTRCGIWPEMLDETGLSYARYIERALRTPAMLFLRNGRFCQAERIPFAEYAKLGFEDTVITVEDFLLHLTSLFPEVRPKTYVELRGADCAPPLESLAIAGFWRGLLDDEDTRQAADERLSSLTFEDLKQLQKDVARVGLEAKSPIGEVGEIIKGLVESSYNRMEKSAPDCAECILPILKRAHRKKSLADDMLEKAATSSVDEAIKLCQVH